MYIYLSLMSLSLLEAKDGIQSMISAQITVLLPINIDLPNGIDDLFTFIDWLYSGRFFFFLFMDISIIPQNR